MNSIVKNILAVVTGGIVGSAVNMGLIMAGPHVIPPPEGAVLTTEEGLKASMHLMQPKHFLFPFLAHALGTFVGAYLAALIAANRKMLMAMVISALFLIGGIQMVMMLPSPLWFSIADLVVAYIPMGYLAAIFAIKEEE
ncbi:MAG: hypothetical protein HYZ42_13935 [Bacteroidetes bacterium]|nr:hypothetical protein [Bacteroidota bacterium]